MKNKKTLFLTLLLAVSTLSGCGNSAAKTPINIGSKLESIKELNREVDLLALLSSKIGEGVLLATYSKSMSSGCSCWTGFKEEILNKYVKLNNVPIYFFDTDKISDTTIKKYGIKQLTSSDPQFYVFEGGKKKHAYKALDSKISTYKKFQNEMNRILEIPEKFKIFYVDENFLFSTGVNQFDAENTVLLTERNACGDCSYIIPNVIVPYVKEHDLKTEILVIDIQEQNWNGNDGEDYLNMIKKLQLSEESNPTFGYGRGYVPTIQYYQKSTLKDACVSFNDVLVNEGDHFVVSQSYYTQERVENLSFLKNSQIENKVLKGLNVPASDVNPSYNFWTHEAASKYHTPILEAFLNTYCLL